MTNEPTQITISCPHLLVVEGKDEENFFNALLCYIEIPNTQVLPIGGRDKLRERLKLLKASRKFRDVKSVGIVRDGDGNNKGAFDSVCSALQGAQFPAPPKPLALSGGYPRVSVMIMPPEKVESGRMLEDLCLAAVTKDPSTRSAMHCVDDYFKCLGEQAGISHKINALPKARIHAFLASRPDPELRLGEAAQRGYFPLDSPVFKPVIDYLTQLAS